MGKFVVVSASDANYFSILKDWFTCIRSLQELAQFDIGILDIGLAADQVAWVKEQGAQIVVPDWEFNFPEKHRMPAFLRAMSAKPMHGGIISENIEGVSFSKIVCHFQSSAYFSRPTRSFHLSRACGTNQRARSERSTTKNSALNEESRSNSGHNNNAKSH